MIIIGLGNPGGKYEKTRHNAGFLALDKIKKSWDFPDFKFEKKFNAQILEGQLENKRSKVLLIKPQTFMNNSGISVQKILDFYKLSPDDIIIIHDDLDIPLGEIRIAADSRSAGHNGVQNIIDTLGTQKFKRIRIGIGKSPQEKSSCPLSGHPPRVDSPRFGEAGKRFSPRVEVGDYVLGNFSEKELVSLEKVFKKTTEEIEELIN